MTISLIVAADLDNAIGLGDAMPWRLRADLRRFRKITMGHPIIMGRKTFETLKKPLGGRTNIVLTRRADYDVPEGVLVCATLDDALAAAAEADGAEEIFIGGGGEIYRRALPLAERVYLTRVLAHTGGDVFFPALDLEQWDEVEREERFADADNDHPTEFVVLDRLGRG